jgi:hypothetical protein
VPLRRAATEAGEVLGSQRDAARVAHHTPGAARGRGGRPSRMYPRALVAGV